MKKLNFQLLAGLFIAMVIGFTACDKNDDDDDTPTEKVMDQDTKFAISSEDASVSAMNASIADIQSYFEDAANGNTYDADPGVAYENASTENSLNLMPTAGGPAFHSAG